MEELLPRDALVGSPLRLNLGARGEDLGIKVACGGTVVPGANRMNPEVPFIWYKLLLL